MDRKWIIADRLSKEYKNGVKEFCTHAARHATNPGFITCPCKKCVNVKTVSGREELYEHLICHGIDKTYTVWTYHGEGKGQYSSNHSGPDFCSFDKIDTNIGCDDRDGASSPIMDTPYVANEELRDHPYMHEKLKADAGLPLWPGIVTSCERFVPIEAGYARVQFEVGVEEEKDTLLPVPCDEARTVGEAPRYFLPWPKKLVSLEKLILEPTNNKGTGKLHKTSDQFRKAKENGKEKEREKTLYSTSGAPHKPLGYPLPGDSIHDDVILVLLRNVLRTINIIEVPIDSYFDGESWIESIAQENIKEILNDQWLSSSSIVFYIRYLGDVYLSKNPELAAKFSFAAPHIVPPLVDIPAAANYLADCLLKYNGLDHLVLMPHNVGKHWVLVAINTQTEVIYYMDSAADGRIGKNKMLKTIVENGMIAFRTRRPGNTKKAEFNKFKWNNIQCPKQPDGIHCGHYVGCFIEGILLSGETSIPLYFVHTNPVKFYPPSKMKSFQVNWAGYLYNRFLKKKLTED